MVSSSAPAAKSNFVIISSSVLFFFNHLQSASLQLLPCPYVTCRHIFNFQNDFRPTNQEPPVQITCWNSSISVLSQVESMGSMGTMFGHLRWRAQDKEKNLCEDLDNSPVHWATGWSPEMWEGSMPWSVKPCLNFPLPPFQNHWYHFFYLCIMYLQLHCFLHVSLHSQMSACVHGWPSQSGLQPLCVWQSHPIWTSPKCDWCPCGGGLGDTGQSTQGSPRSNRCQRSAKALRNLLF